VFDIGSELFPMLVEKGLPFYAQDRFFNWIDIGRGQLGAHQGFPF
jgi:mannose-1-phosphate guanylyltransferase